MRLLQEIPVFPAMYMILLFELVSFLIKSANSLIVYSSGLPTCEQILRRRGTTLRIHTYQY